MSECFGFGLRSEPWSGLFLVLLLSLSLSGSGLGLVLAMRRRRVRVVLTVVLLVLTLLLSSFLLPQDGRVNCGGSHCKSGHQSGLDLWEEPGLIDSALRHCPGQSFQSSVLMRHLRACLTEEGDVLIGPYLQSWDQLVLFMESLGTMVGFFSNKVKEKMSLIRQLSLKHHEDSGKHVPSIEEYGLQQGVYQSVRSMVVSELDRGLVGFSFRTESGCRTLLRLHRSLLWVKLVLQGLSQDPDQDGVYRTPGEIAREAYAVALAPHHSWFLRNAAELVFVALPERKYFLQLVCVSSQSEAAPALHIIIQGLTRVHERTQAILEQHGLLLLP